jgi:hypothetical protein
MFGYNSLTSALPGQQSREGGAAHASCCALLYIIRPLGLIGNFDLFLTVCEYVQCPLTLSYHDGCGVCVSGNVGNALMRPQFIYSNAVAWACVVHQKTCRHQMYVGAYCPLLSPEGS